MRTIARILCAFGAAIAVFTANGSALAVEAPVRIMPLGDSLTSGVSTYTVVGAYRNRLYTLLTNAGYNVDFVGTFNDSSNPGLPDVNHQGQGSARIDQIQSNIAGWLNTVEDPDVVLLLIGTNDFWQSYDIANAQTRLNNLIGEIATRRPFAKIIVSTLPIRTDNATTESQQVSYNSAIPGIVAQHVALGRQVTYVDMHAGLVASDINGDGVHPSQAGFDKMADVWYPAIAAVVGPKGTSNPPLIAKIGPFVDQTHLSVVFSKPVADTAAALGNFSLSGGLTISNATLDSTSKRTVTLTTSARTPGIVYNLSLTGVRDRTTQQNLIAPGSMINFSSSALTNGSFESDFSGWTTTGNQEIKSASPYTTTNGSKVVAFNTGQSTPNGTLSQTFATTPGQVYQLTFDVGAFGYTTSSQRIQVAVQGSSSLVSDSTTVTPLGNGTTVWTSKVYTFTANSASTTLTFTDTSTTSSSVDLILDNVVVGPQSGKYLAVTTFPDAGASVTVSPSDISGNGTGTTGFLRTYAANTSVTLTAPGSNAGKNFLRWQKNGVDLVGSGTAISVSMDGNHAMNAVYGSNNAPVATADAYAATSNATLTVPAIGVLTNDSDSDGNPLTAVLNAAPTHGTLALNPNGSFTYTPTSGYTGPDSFTYHANDGSSDSNVTTVSLTVNAAANQLVTNGSFENNLTGWTTSGNMQIQTSSTYYNPTNGTKLLGFNTGNTTPNGVLSQSFATVSGQTYQLTFDLGILAFNTNSQKVQVAATGSGNLLSQSITLTGNSSGTSRWFPQSFSFVANSATTTISFTDTSTTTSNADLLLDNVQVIGSTPNYSLTVASSPSSNVGVAISPPDRNSNSGGNTSFTRSYSSGSIVNLSAPTSAGGSAFQKWQKNGVDLSANPGTSVTIDADMTLTAIYGVNTAPVAVADSYSTPLNTVLATPASGVLSNDSDPDLNPITAVLNVGPTNGTLTLNPNGGFSYTPTTGFTGTDSFTYHANDGILDSNVVTVTINVIGGGSSALVNGSFEDGENGWTITGSRFVIDSTPPYLPSEGNKLAVLNGGNQTPNAVFSQTFATTPGNSYILAFDMGVIGVNTSEQKLGISLTGSSSLLTTTESQFCNGLNNAAWTPKSYVFTANSATTTVSFTDMSSSTGGVDLLLDNVRVNGSGAAATQALTVTSTPATGVGITVSPVDNSSNGNGTTQFTRTYNTSTVVSLAAPATFGTDNFVKWQKDGADLTTSTNASVTMDAPHTLTAIYQSAPAAQPFTNGGFEAGENGWTMTGNRVVIDTTPPYIASEGSKLLVFNGGNTAPNAVVTQTFQTTAGQNYNLTFDVGILSSAAVQQALGVAVNGSSSLITQTETLTGNASGNAVWSSKTYSFTANSAATTLTFTDLSPTTNGADLLLDKVAVGVVVANTPPVAVADSYNTNKNTLLTVPAAGVLTNDTDANLNPLTAILVANVAHGTLALSANGGFTYNPTTDYVGADSFTYKANDGTANSNIVTVTLNVSPSVILVNGSFESGEAGWTMTGNRLAYTADSTYLASDGAKLLVLNGGPATPDATVSQTFPTIAGQAYVLSFDVGTVAVNTSTQKLKIQLVGNATTLASDFANLTGNGAGNTNYLHAAIPFTANSSSTTLTFTDQSANTNGIDMVLDNVVVTLGTSAPNVIPVANNDSYIADANTALVVPAAGVLSNDTDGDSDPLTAVQVTGPSHGTLTLNANGGFTYTPTSGYSGSDSFTYKANDAEADSNVATVSITVNAPVVVNGFVNGSFESDFTGWTTTGNVAIQSASPYAPTNGAKLAAFNSGNTTPNGVVSQAFATTPGITYSLTFDAGVLSYTTASQKLQVNVNGTASLLNQTVTITRTSGSNNLWLPQSFSFVADSATTTLSFTDTSATTNLLDLVLDNVVVTANTPVTTRTLTVTSTPSTGATITVSPADNGSNANGATQFTRTYNSGAAVTLTAPATFSGNTFSKWQKNGVDLTTNASATVTMDADYTLTAIYTVPSGSGPNLLTNGSFESNFTGWANTGNVEIQSASPYTATDGTKLAGFNGANATPNGVVSQSFTTTPGATYVLAFDAGVLSYNASSQKLQVNVNGTAALMNQTVTITRSGGSNNLWLPQTFSFVADSATTTLSFTDTSATTEGLDLVLDNVRVTLNSGVPVLQTLSVTSTPVSAVAITVSPNDSNGSGNGSTSFSRAYASNTVVTLTAPATASGSAFIKWKKDNVDLTTNLSTTVTMDTAHTMTAVYANAAFANGSFETGTLSPWVTSGGTSDSVRINSVLGGTDGSKIVEFNASNSPVGGVLAQTFATTAGVTYNLTFDLGVVAFNTSSQSIRVAVTGTGSLLNQTTSITGTSNGVAKWESRSYSFTADSTATTLTFTDLSSVTNSIDMLLDNVKVINASSRTLTIDSVVASAVPITISPADSNGDSNGNTALVRTYNTGTVVSVSAPATAANGATFTKWVKDGADFATTPATSVTVSAHTKMYAVYSGGTNPPLGSNLILNGSFELNPDYANWAHSGATRIEKPGSAYTTDGDQMLSFNVGGGATDGMVQQSFATTAGTTYTLQLDPGVYGGSSGAAIIQTLNINVIGNSVLLSKSVNIQGTTSTFVWSPQTLTFTADSNTTTLILADGSSTGAGTDLFVDNVRVRAGTLAPSTLTVTSTPSSGKVVTATADLAGQGDGTTTFNRIYTTGTSTAMVAPYQNFVKWLKDGAWYATNPSINVVVDANHTMTAVYTSTPVLGPFTNGSFEQEFTGWTWSGSQQSVKVKDGLPTTDGLNIIEFNSNSSNTDGAITQTFTTTAGTLYTLTFDMGVNAFNTQQQSMRCLVTGSGTLVNQTFSMNNPSANGVVYATKTVTFTANSATTTLTFSDVSATGVGLDMLLDNVRLNGSTGGGGTTRTLTVTSTPSTGAAITVSPADNSSNANGTTQFTRTYNNNTAVTLTAPATFSGYTFSKWQKNGSDVTTNSSTTVTMDADYTLTAVYTTPVAGAFTNGNFEQDFTAWTTSGSTNSILIGSGLSGSNSSKIASFNSGNSPNDGQVAQTFTTVSGTTYTVTIDMGVLAFNTSAQTLQVSATGSGNLLSQNFTINGTGGGNVVWSTKTATFTANSATTTLAFRDVSSTGANIDLLLDNVTVTTGSGGPTTRTLTVTSSPATGAAITVSPIDNSSQGNGTTQFTRTYNNGTTVTLTAPSTLSGNSFLKWQKNGVDAGTNVAATVTMDADYTMTAIYQSAGGSSLLANYSFESGLTNWNTAGGSGTVSTDSTLAASHGSTLAKFNGGNTANTGELSQAFATTSGTSYLVTFDMGVLGYNTNSQTLGVSATGTGTLNTDSFTASANGSGNIVWTTRTFIFTANSATSTLTFKDLSASTNAIDLLLDNVRVEVTTAPSMGPNLIYNGSWELSTPPQDYNGWTQSGSTRIEWPGPQYSTDGAKILSYGVGETPTDGSVSQSFATVPGATYRVRFDLGALGYAAINLTLRVKVDGSGNLLNQTTSVLSRDDFVMVWSAKSFDFVANSTTTTLTLSDASASGSATDMFLDNVRVNSIATAAAPPVEGEPQAASMMSGASDEEQATGVQPPAGTPAMPMLTGTPGNMRIALNATEPGLYILERSEDLKTWNFQNQIEVTEPREIEFFDTEAGKNRMFYRIGKVTEGP